MSQNIKNFMIQLRNSEKIMQELHEKLIEEGYEWDGMDGYFKNDKFVLNDRCHQPVYCLVNCPEDYFNPDKCKDCEDEHN